MDEQVLSMVEATSCEVEAALHYLELTDGDVGSAISLLMETRRTEDEQRGNEEHDEVRRGSPSPSPIVMVPDNEEENSGSLPQPPLSSSPPSAHGRVSESSPLSSAPHRTSSSSSTGAVEVPIETSILRPRTANLSSAVHDPRRFPATTTATLSTRRLGNRRGQDRGNANAEERRHSNGPAQHVVRLQRVPQQLRSSQTDQPGSPPSSSSALSYLPRWVRRSDTVDFSHMMAEGRDFNRWVLVSLRGDMGGPAGAAHASFWTDEEHSKRLKDRAICYDVAATEEGEGRRIAADLPWVLKGLNAHPLGLINPFTEETLLEVPQDEGEDSGGLDVDRVYETLFYYLSRLPDPATLTRGVYGLGGEEGARRTGRWRRRRRDSGLESSESSTEEISTDEEDDDVDTMLLLEHHRDPFSADRF